MLELAGHMTAEIPSLMELLFKEGDGLYNTMSGSNKDFEEKESRCEGGGCCRKLKAGLHEKPRAWEETYTEGGKVWGKTSPLALACTACPGWETGCGPGGVARPGTWRKSAVKAEVHLPLGNFLRGCQHPRSWVGWPGNQLASLESQLH